MPRIAVLVLVSALALFSFIGLWEGAGCGLDPGGCPAAPGADEGCILDPGGRCAPAPSQDEGCGLDPGGHACPGRQ